MTCFRKVLKLLEPPKQFGTSTYWAQINAHVKVFIGGPRRISGIVHLLRILSFLSLAILCSPFCYVAQLLGFRFVVVDLSQIGSLLWLDSFLREDRLNKKTPKIKMLICRDGATCANAYILDLYEPYVTYVSNPFLKIILSPFFVNPWLQSNTREYEHTRTFSGKIENEKNRTQKIYQEYAGSFGLNLISIPPEDICKGYDIIKDILPKDRPFVTMHARESGFNREKYKSLRNSNIRDVESACKHLIARGFFIFRMGDSSMSPISEMASRLGGNIFDYANSNIRSDFMDCFLISECDFFVGGSSGLSSIPPLFGTNSVNVNFYNTNISLGFIPGDLTAFKKYRYKESDELIDFYKSVRPPFNRNLTPAEMDEHGVYLEDNTDVEILATVREYVENPAAQETQLQKISKQSLPAGSFSYQAKGNYSDFLLSIYKESNSRTFTAR
jgi:putative glycosyltransferase (TIGR04372 family)